MLPAIAAVRSLRMSPNRFEATITSSDSGALTTRAQSASIRTRSTSTAGCSAATSSTTSSQNGIVWMIPFDFVADTRRPSRSSARRKAWRAIRSIPCRVKIACWEASSLGRPRYIRPPTSEYSPSTFSRTTTMSISASPASGPGTPGICRIGRRARYWSKVRRIGISSPHSEMWSGTPGAPTAPRKIAS